MTGVKIYVGYWVLCSVHLQAFSIILSHVIVERKMGSRLISPGMSERLERTFRSSFLHHRFDFLDTSSVD